MRTFSDHIKSIIIVLLVVMLALLSGMRLMDIQVVGDENILTPENSDDAIVYKRYRYK